MVASADELKAGDEILFYDVGASEPSRGEIIGKHELKAPCICTQRDAEGKPFSTRLNENKMGLVILNCDTGLTAGTFHPSCVVKKTGNRRRSQ